MKKEKLVKISVCDFCGSEESVFDFCIVCKRDVCYKCNKNNVGKEFKHGVYFSGSGDGFFCNSCMANMPLEYQPLFNAYLEVKALRDQQEAWNEGFQKRSKEAEIRLGKLLKEQREESQ